MILRTDGHRGFSLVEIVLALGIAAFCLVSISGLLLFGFQSSTSTFERTAAAGVGAAVIAELQATPAAASASAPKFNIPIQPSGGATVTPTTFNVDQSGTPGALGVAPTFTSLYRVAFLLTPPAAGQRSATSVRIVVSWPASSDPTVSTWPKHAQGTWETVVNLDRN